VGKAPGFFFPFRGGGVCGSVLFPAARIGLYTSCFFYCARRQPCFLVPSGRFRVFSVRWPHFPLFSLFSPRKPAAPLWPFPNTTGSPQRRKHHPHPVVFRHPRPGEGVSLPVLSCPLVRSILLLIHPGPFVFFFFPHPLPLRVTFSGNVRGLFFPPILTPLLFFSSSGRLLLFLGNFITSRLERRLTPSL